MLDSCSEFPKQTFNAGECVLQEEEFTGRLYVLVDGCVEVRKQGVVLAKVSEPGTVFGEVSALLGTPHMATVIAVEKSEFHVIAHARLFVRGNPEVAFHLCTFLAQRLTSVTKYLTNVKGSLDHLMKTHVEANVTVSTEELKATQTVRADPKPTGNETTIGVLRCGVVDKEAQALSTERQG